MKKTLIIILSALVLLAAAYIVLPGFARCSSVYIEEYELSPDGSEMTIRTGVGSSVGFTRKAAVHQQEGGRLYLDFYSAFGGINGSIGAKNVFTLPIDSETASIRIYRNADCYEEVLVKDDSGSWQRV